MAQRGSPAANAVLARGAAGGVALQRTSSAAAASTSAGSTSSGTRPASPPPPSSPPLYRTFLPAQPNSISAQDNIPPLAQLQRLGEHLHELRRDSGLALRTRLDGDEAADLAGLPRSSAVAGPSSQRVVAAAPAAAAPAAAVATSPPPLRRIKVKLDPDRVASAAAAGPEAQPSARARATPTPVAPTFAAAGSSTAAQSAPTEREEADLAAAKPAAARTYAQQRKKRKRDGTSVMDSDASASERGSPAPRQQSVVRGERVVSAAGSTIERSEAAAAGPSSASSAPPIKLKLKAVPSRPRRDSHQVMGSISSMIAPHAPSPAWDLPARTFQIPTLAPVHRPRTYPVRPVEVTQDFASQDWKERERERDRMDLAAGAAAVAAGGLPAAQTAVGRARDKKGEQTPYHVFQSYTDAWFRTLTEDDLAWLSSRPDEHEAFQLPPLGRHYSEIWALEDAAEGAESDSAAAAAVRAAHAPGTSAHLGIPPAPNFDPRTLRDEHAFGTARDEARGGPLTERLMAALLPMPPPPKEAGLNGSTSHTREPTSGSTHVNGNGNAAAGPSQLPAQTNGHSQPSQANGHEAGPSSLQPQQHAPVSPSKSQDMLSFEDRVRNELTSLEVLGDEPIDWSARQDDEISSTLRNVQRALRQQMDINAARKERLFHIAMDRMAYQDYLSCMASVEKEIEVGWNKRQAAIKRSLAPKKKKAAAAAAAAAAGTSQAAASAGASGAASTSAAPPNGAAAAIVAAETSGGAGDSAVGTPTQGSGVSGPAPPQFSDALVAALQRRKKLKYAFAPMFANTPHAWRTPGPDESVFADLPGGAAVSQPQPEQ